MVGGYNYDQIYTNDTINSIKHMLYKAIIIGIVWNMKKKYYKKEKWGESNTVVIL